MTHALWTGASGMSAQQTNVDVIANNIANVNTTGFKKQRVNFQDMFYDVVAAPGTRASDQGRNPTGIQVGHGVKLSSTPRLFSPGNIEQTGNPYDMSIDGEGFFQVTTPDGRPAYTRAGDFRPDSDGNMVTPDGYYLEPRITVPDGATSPSVSPTGVVSAIVNGTQTELGTLTLTRFRNPSGLIAEGRNLFVESAASGSPVTGTPGSDGFGHIGQNQLEKANVEIVNELVSLIVAQRAFEMNSKSITTAEQMLQQANEIVR